VGLNGFGAKGACPGANSLPEDAQPERDGSPMDRRGWKNPTLMGLTPIIEAPWRSGLRGARANLVPGLALWLAALAIVLGYYFEPPVHALLSGLAGIRRSAGFGFGIASTAVFGGLLPFLYIRYGRRNGKGIPQYGWTQGSMLTLFWAYKGLEIELWYRLQAYVVGSGHGAATIALKVFLDQYVYCPFFAVPVTTAVYQAVQAWPDWAWVGADMRERGWYRRRALPVLIANMAVWVPAVAVIYALPTPLQLPMQNMVLCFYTLIVAHQMRADRPPAEAAT